MPLLLQPEAEAETAAQQPWHLQREAQKSAAPQLPLPLASGAQVAPTGLPVSGAAVQMKRHGGARPSRPQEGALQSLRPAAGHRPALGSPSSLLLPVSRRQQSAAGAPLLLLLLQGALKAGGRPPL